MTQLDPASALITYVGPLTHLLDETVAQAIRTSEGLLARYEHRRFGFIRPLAVRLETRLRLESQVLPDGWAVGGDPRLMGQLIIEKPGVMEMRFLKGNPLQPGRIPVAGHNRQRRDYWSQDALVEWPSPPTEPLKFLMVWNYLDAVNRDEGYTLHVAHPVGPGSYGSRVPCDLVVEVPRGGTFFEGLKPFAHDDDEDLFVRIAEEEHQQ